MVVSDGDNIRRRQKSHLKSDGENKKHTKAGSFVTRLEPVYVRQSNSYYILRLIRTPLPCSFVVECLIDLCKHLQTSILLKAQQTSRKYNMKKITNKYTNKIRV